jgi:3-oxoadipate enol-lactonase / 4-carboxymuconolactone decarboxylase
MFLNINDLTVHLQLDGPIDAPPLLLVHSLGTSNAIWDTQVAALRRSFYVIRFDLRGHGLTTATPGPYDIAVLARDALAVLDSLGIASAHVAGISIGGLIAQSLTVQAPARVRSLILVDTALVFQPPENYRHRAARVRADGIAPLADGVIARWVTPAFLEAPETTGLRTMLLRTPPEGYAACAEAIGAADFTETSRSIRAAPWWSSVPRTRRRRPPAPRPCATRSRAPIWLCCRTLRTYQPWSSRWRCWRR